MDGNILIVDDEPDICWAIGHILEKRGLTCRHSLTADGAVALMKSERFRMAFLDVTLPDMQGLELARLLRSMDPSMVIVIVTGFMPPGQDGAPSANEGLYRRCIYKPFQNQEVIDVVESCL
jgi:DNA-binding NtrC family response regulator